MPIYEFTCNSCKEEFETLVMGSRKVVCPGCGAEDITKKMSVFGVSGVTKQVSSGGGSCGGCSKSSCSTC